MSSWRSRSSRRGCTVDDLIDIIKAPSGGTYVYPSQPYNEVYPGIFVGDASFAMDPKALRDAGVTAVVNAAEGMDWCRYVDTGASFYSSVKLPVSYYGIKALDCSTFSLFPYFDSVASFINDNLQAGGKVLVHCKQGISRSSTLVIAFLMLKRGMSAQEALAIVRSKREVMPNEGFLQQLCDLNERLERERQ